ncbi:hypothetical protein [Actinopolymorpha alba]|uniref:hypothetical protein n=1 Tax=Actinopolymorpha alba TaxID=533267 RepID=UPI00037009E6|nr:hypothetical protein [Actinopolymorpha alba]
MSVVVVGIGGGVPHTWAIGPRVVERLGGEMLTGVRLLTSSHIPVRLLRADTDIDELIVVESTHDGGVPGAVRQSALEAHGPSSAGPETGVFGLLSALRMPRRVVVFSVETGGAGRGPAAEEAGEDAGSAAADAAVESVVHMILAELRHPGGHDCGVPSETSPAVAASGAGAS